ncbi:hypothetical protein BH11PAT4_BH11PAT4_5210 [soil metagenome]
MIFKPARTDRKYSQQASIRPSAIRLAGAQLLAGFLLLGTLFSVAPYQVKDAAAATGVPRAFSYQGRLYDSSGNLLGGSGTIYCFKFSLWDNATPGSGTRLWPASGPSSAQLTVKYGVFSANVGLDTPDPLTYNFYDNDTIFLQVEVAAYSGGCGSFETLAPRKQMVASGYAINSDLLDGATSGTNVNNILKLDASGNIGLTASNPVISASSTNTLTIQGYGATGDLQFFGTANKITSSGALTLFGSVTAASATFSSSSGINLGAASSANGTIVLSNASNANTLSITSASTSGTYSLILPAAQGGSNTVLRNDGSGNLSWASPSCVNCILNNSAATSASNAIAPTNDIISLQVRQTTASSPTSNILEVEDATGVSQYLVVASTGAVTLAPSAGQALFMNLAAGSQARVVATAAPTDDLFEVSNAGLGTTTANANGIRVDYVGGAAAVEGSGVRIEVNPGSTSGGTWNGMRFVANVTGAVSGVALNGVKLDGPTSPGAGTETALNVGSGWDVGLNLASGGMQMTEIGDPSAPASDVLRLYSSDVAGSTMVKVRASTGKAYSLQPSLAESSFFLVSPNTSSSVNAIGSAVTSDGTISHPAASEAAGYMANFQSGSSAGDTAGTGNASLNNFRGSTSGSNGWFFYSRLYFPDTLTNYADTSTGSRIFVGMTNQTMAASVGSDDPSGHRAGFSLVPARDVGSYHWKFSTKDNSTESVADLGVAFAPSKVYDFYMYVAPQGSTVYYRLDNITDNVTTNGSTSSNLPGTSTALRPGFQIETLDSVAKNVRMQKLYVSVPSGY